MNPNENDLTRDEPLPAQQFQPNEEDLGSIGREQFRRATQKVSTEMSQTWDQTKEKASRALERTEHFVRENPMPTILSALGIGIAIGLAIRYAAPSESKREIVLESPWGALFMVFHCSSGEAPGPGAMVEVVRSKSGQFSLPS